jgi:hypothetical protein
VIDVCTFLPRHTFIEGPIPMDPSIRKGYLVLADITGYTLFLAASELPHAQVILREILSVIMKSFTPTLRIAEVEGDAIFAYAPDERLVRGETLLELVEATYLAFRELRATKERMSTCACEACHAIPTLDLKFVVHHGEFIEQKFDGKPKPVGSSVKNGISEATGWRGYLLFSEDAINAMQIRPCDMYDCIESYEHLGSVDTHALDLDTRYRELTEARYNFLDREQAFTTTEVRVAGHPSLVWEWLNEPEHRKVWWQGSGWHFVQNPNGRTGRGTTNHCSQSNFTEYVLDWRPFSYFTVKRKKGMFTILETTELEPIADGTLVRWNHSIELPLPRWLRRRICNWVIYKGIKMEENAVALGRILAEASVEYRDAVVDEEYRM